MTQRATTPLKGGRAGCGVTQRGRIDASHAKCVLTVGGSSGPRITHQCGDLRHRYFRYRAGAKVFRRRYGEIGIPVSGMTSSQQIGPGVFEAELAGIQFDIADETRGDEVSNENPSRRYLSMGLKFHESILVPLADCQQVIPGTILDCGI